jgi:membrane-associated phospholipid phosphatase
MTVRQLLITAAICAGLTALAILLVDAPVARALARADAGAALLRGLDQLLRWLDECTFMDLPRGMFSTIAIVAGGVLWWWRRDVGRAALILGIVHAVSRVGGSYLKPVFGRLRPGEAIERGLLDDTWFRDGVGFPSGHVGHYAALAFTAMVLWPRSRIPAALVLAVVIAARVGRNAHFVSDVTGALAIAALAAAGAAQMLPRSGR